VFLFTIPCLTMVPAIVPSFGTIAGPMVTEGIVKRNSGMLVKRGGETIHEGKVVSLKRFKDDVAEVRGGYECGIGVDNFTAFEEGDILEAFEEVEVARRL